MDSSSVIAVTGATGKLGGRVARRLAAAGLRQRLLLRDPTRAPELPGTQIATASYADSAAVTSALTGVELAFMVSAAEAPDRRAHHLSFIDAAVAAGVRHLVYTSFFGAAADATFTLARDHWATEEHLRASGLTYTVLRDNLYLDFLPYMAGDDGVIRGPAGDGRVSAVAIDDIADVVAAVLHNPAAHADTTYDLTGPEALSLTDVARLLSEAAGKTITYHPETLDEAYASRARYGAPDWQVDAWVSTYTAIAKGEMAAVSNAVDQVTGHRPRSLRELLSKIA